MTDEALNKLIASFDENRDGDFDVVKPVPPRRLAPRRETSASACRLLPTGSIPGRASPWPTDAAAARQGRSGAAPWPASPPAPRKRPPPPP